MKKAFTHPQPCTTGDAHSWLSDSWADFRPHTVLCGPLATSGALRPHLDFSSDLVAVAAAAAAGHTQLRDTSRFCRKTV